MNDIVKVLLGFTAGGIVGAVVGNRMAAKELNEHMDEVEADRERIRQALAEERKKRRELVKKFEDDADSRLKEQGIEMEHNGDMDEETYPPSVIDEASFRSDMPYIDYFVLTYFAKDGVLIDENEERIFCPVDEIGEEALDLLRKGEEKPIYVHNYERNVDFEIVINTKETYSDYMGEYEDEEEE